MDSALADRLAARHHLQHAGLDCAASSEAFPPPAAARAGRLDRRATPTPLRCEASHPVRRGLDCCSPCIAIGNHGASGMDARWLDALDPTQRSALFAGLPRPGNTGVDDEAAPFAWAHRALCRQGLRLRIQHAAGQGCGGLRHRLAAPAPPTARHQCRGAAAWCWSWKPWRALRAHRNPRARGPAPASHAVVQNLHTHIHLAAGAQLQHLRLALPWPNDRVAQHVHANGLPPGAHYAQALVATGASYHLQRTTLQLQAPSARRRAPPRCCCPAAHRCWSSRCYTRHGRRPHPRTAPKTLALAARP
jgi:Fe-S cluster assembly protein SufD